MNKKLLTAAIATGFMLPFAAHADVKVYGAAQVELASYSDETGDTGVDAGAAGKGVGPKDQLLEEDNARGRIGVKASEDLGGGLKGLAKFEWKTDTTQAAALTPRESLVGLKGGFGTVMLGSLKAPYKYTGGVKYDIFVTTSLQARGHGGMSQKVGYDNSFGHNGFMKKAIGWKSPSMGGMSAWVNFRLDEGGVNDQGDSNELDGSYSLALKYANGPFEAFVAANDDDSAGTETYNAVKIGGKFKSGPIAVMGQLEMIDNLGTDEQVLFLAGHYKMGKNILVLQIGQNDVDDANDVDAGTYMALGLVHKFTKSTRLFVGFRSYTDAENVFAVGMRKDFSS